VGQNTLYQRFKNNNQIIKGRLKKMVEGYCVKCKKKVEMKDPIETKTSKGTPMRKGKCPECNTTVCRIGK
jgi:hypothetical protein